MADNRDKVEVKIPVFSVLKKGGILKYIFLNSPPSPAPATQEPERGGGGGDDDPILVGRHPDCHIVLDHPSISRFHLEVRVKPASQKLSVTDRSSVHGTWVSGKKIEPCVPVDLVEGDVLRLGASTRAYRLQWILPRRASEMGSPLEALLEEKEETHQMENPEIFAENMYETWAVGMPSAPSMPESVNLSSTERSVLKELKEKGNPLMHMVGENKTPEVFSAAEVSLEKENSSSLRSETGVSSSSLLARRNKSVGSLRIPTTNSRGRMGCSRLDENMHLEILKPDFVDFEQCEILEKYCNLLSDNLAGNEEAKDEIFGSVVEKFSFDQKLKSYDKIKKQLQLDTIADVTEEHLALDMYNSAFYTQILQESSTQTRSPNAIGGLNEEDGYSLEEVIKSPALTGVHDQMPPTFQTYENILEEETFVSDKENIKLIVPQSQKLPESLFGIKRFPMDAIAILNEGVLSNGETSSPVIARELKPEKSISEECVKIYGEELPEEDDEERFFSDKENMTPVVSHGKKSHKSRFATQKVPLNALAALDNEAGLLSDGENSTPKATSMMKIKQAIGEHFRDNYSGQLKGGEKTFISEKENMTPLVSCGRRSVKSLLEVQGSSSKDIASICSEESSNSCSENWTPQASIDLKLKDSILDYSLRSNLEAFDKENLAPDTCYNQKLKSDTDVTRSFSNIIMGSNKENWTSQVSRAQEGEQPSPASNKENLTPCASGALRSGKTPLSVSHAELERQITKKRMERIPFQSLLNSPMKGSGPVHGAQKDVDKSDNSPLSSRSKTRSSLGKNQRIDTMNQSVYQFPSKVVEDKKTWNIVVDTSCFLSEGSRRSLQLLEGLKGTHLIIPRMVIRELDCLKRRECWYQKTPNASSALQWIKECMVRASWWIHVQSSSDTLRVPPTPPASPQLLLDEGTGELGGAVANSMSFSTVGSLTEILSPTAEDHILDCALLFRRIKTDGQLILLSNNITLKIKAMAEGLLCETPVEFRESLVNPFSKRFLWTESSPRGSTWSFSDEMSIMQNYYCHQLPYTRKMTKVAERAKGLKLILLQNSQYGQRSP